MRLRPHLSRFFEYSLQNAFALIPLFSFALALSLSPYFVSILADCPEPRPGLTLNDYRTAGSVVIPEPTRPSEIENPDRYFKEAARSKGNVLLCKTELWWAATKGYLRDNVGSYPSQPPESAAPPAREARKRTVWIISLSLVVYSSLGAMIGAFIVAFKAVRGIGFVRRFVFMIFIILSAWAMFELMSIYVLPLILGSRIVLAPEHWFPYYYFNYNPLSYLADHIMPGIDGALQIADAVMWGFAVSTLIAVSCLLVWENVEQPDVIQIGELAERLTSRMRWLRVLLYLSAIVLVTSVFHV